MKKAIAEKEDAISAAQKERANLEAALNKAVEENKKITGERDAAVKHAE